MLNIKVCKHTILLTVLYGCKETSLILKEEHEVESTLSHI
jgi:hypothetical protein